MPYDLLPKSRHHIEEVIQDLKELKSTLARWRPLDGSLEEKSKTLLEEARELQDQIDAAQQ